MKQIPTITAVLLASFGAGCACQPASAACSETADCPAGYSCVQQLCVRSADAGSSDGSLADAIVVDATATDATHLDHGAISDAVADSGHFDGSRDAVAIDRAGTDLQPDDSAAADRATFDAAAVVDAAPAGDAACRDGMPINGGWSSPAWDSWNNIGGCSFCLQQQQRNGTRSCTNPSPACGGADCQGSTSMSETQTVACNVVNGGWGGWNSSSACSAPCNGVQTLTRACDSPAPACGGAYCPGADTETVVCNPPSQCGEGFWSCSGSNQCLCETEICPGNFCRADYGCCTDAYCINTYCLNHCANAICAYDHVCNCC